MDSNPDSPAGGHTLLWSNGGMTDFNSFMPTTYSGYTLLDACVINDNGQIVGDYSTSYGTRAFLLTPVVATVPLPHRRGCRV